MASSARGAFAIGALATLTACGTGHYATRDHPTEDPATDDHATEDHAASRAGSAESAAGASELALQADAGSPTITTDEEGAREEPLAQPARSSEEPVASDGPRGHAPEEDLARARAAGPANVSITVRTTSGPITPAVARRALEIQRLRVEHCYVTVLGAGASGAMRASITVEASGSSSAELETMMPELDRVLPCVDAALEHTPFPATSDGRPTHIVAEVSRSASR